MIAPEDIVRLARQFSAETGVSISAISSRVFDDGKKLPAMIERDADLTLRRAAVALQWFSDNWPQGARWPDGIHRPKVSNGADAA